MRSLLLGLDVSPRRLGFGLVDLVSGDPVACGCEAIELPKNGWSSKAVKDALRAIYTATGECGACKGTGYRNCKTALGVELLACGCPGGRDGEIQAVYVEHPISRFPGMAYDEGRAVGMVHAEVQRRWPHAPVEYLKPSEWRLLAGLKGNASKDDVLAEAEGYECWPVFFDFHPQDAADALLIAVAGQRRNGENWTRAVERGETGEAA